MDIQPIFLCAAGMDVHLTVIHVCRILQEPGCEPAVHRRQFGAFQRDRCAMAEWIGGFAPDTVVMESTGIYWKSPYAALIPPADHRHAGEREKPLGSLVER